MTFTDYAFDNFISQELSKLTKCNALDLSKQFPQAENWINNFILNSIFRARVSNPDRPFAFGILRRAQMILVEHELGRISLQDYVKGSRDQVSLYFKALGHFESVVSNLYQAFEFGMRLTDIRLYEKNDGSPIERLNRIYNVSKHLEPFTIPESHLHAVWITNDGLSISNGSVTFKELADLIQGICTTADKLSRLPLPDEQDPA